MTNFDLGSYLRDLRENKGLTTRELSEAIGYSYSYIAGVEKGHKENPSNAFLEKYIYGVSKNLHEIEIIKEDIAKGTNGKFYKDFQNREPTEVEKIEKDESLLKAFTIESSPNVFFFERNGLVDDKYFNFPINDIAFHLNDKYNAKYFRKLKMSDEDRKYIYNFINDYYIRKVNIQKEEVIHNKKQGNISEETAKRYISDYESLIKKLENPNDLKY